MSFNKDRVMQELQRFGGAMYTPVILFAFFGLTVALSIIFSNTGLFGSLAEKGTLWYDFWYVVQQGAWTVFNQMPILFAIAVPIGFAKKEQARCAMEGFVIYMVFNYFIAGILTLHGSYFGVDYSQNAGAGTGLAMIANIKTLDMGMLGAIFIACISAYLHNHFYDTEIPDWLGIFKGPAFVVAVGFLVMLPMALLFCYIWPPIQHGIEQFQFFLKTSGIFGVWAYTFSERILLPAGLHHFIYLPFIYGPAVCDGGIQAYWLQHLNDFATSAHSLRDMFPQGGFALHGSAKVFGLPGAALAMYYCAKPEKRKKVATLLIPATITAVLCGITEPIEFTFLFVAPLLYVVHAVLAATLSRRSISSACRATSAAASSTASSRTGSPCSAIMPGPTFCRLPLASALRPFTSSSSASSSFTSICPRRAVPMMAAKTNCSPKRNTKPRKKWKRKALPAVPMP